MGISAFGLNCSAGPEQMLVHLKRLREFARVPLIAKPNAGMPQIVDGKTVYDCPPDEFVALVGEMLDAGVAVFGGCCGTTGEHIAALANALDGAGFVRPAPESTATCSRPQRRKDPMYLPVDAKHGKVLSVTNELEDTLSDALDTDDAMIAIKLSGWDAVDIFADCQYMINKPLCLVCDDADVLDSALRVYQGRALYEGALDESALLPLCDKYGLII